MKRIVNGVTYNTETSTRLAESRWERDDDEKAFGTLYQTRGGAFFVDVEITRQEWNEFERANETKVVHAFEPMSPEKAHQWMLEGEVEVFHNPFDDPPEASAEAEPAATIYLRVPASLKQRVDEAAKGAKVSGNTWAMRCVERCLSDTNIGDFEELFYIWSLAATPRAGSDIEWDRDKCLAALERVARLAEDLAERLLGPKALADGGLTFQYSTTLAEIQKEFAPYS